VGQLAGEAFPAILQNTASCVRHKIVLTDPNAVINEQQYPYGMDIRYGVPAETLGGVERATGSTRCRGANLTVFKPISFPKHDNPKEGPNSVTSLGL
jgi:hypothetical protein